MENLFFLLIGWSITSILVNGSIFDTFRNYLIVKAPFFSKLMTCMQCSGFWVGFIIGLLSISGVIYNPLENLISQEIVHIDDFLTTLSYGFLNSGISVLFNALIIFLVSSNNTDQQ